MAYSNLAQLRMLAADLADTQVWGNRAIELARRFGDVDTEVHALNNVGTALLLAGDERGAALLHQSLDKALLHDMQEHTARAHTNLGSAQTALRRFSAAEEVVRAGLDFCTERDSTPGRPTCAECCPSSSSRPGGGRRREAMPTPS
jgi:hypothetical protein